MTESKLVVVIVAQGSLPLRVPLSRQVTTIGSAADADVRLAVGPDHFAVLRRSGDGVDVLISSTSERHKLAPGVRVSAHDILLEVESALPVIEREQAVDTLVSSLAAVDSAERATELLLGGLISIAQADLGALILVDDGSYRVAAARDRGGAVVGNAAELLSDTIVRDVLGTGERIHLDDIAANSRYGAIQSVTALRLGAVLCLPMRLEGKTLGAVFLARHTRTQIDERVLSELRIVAAVAVPFLAQLRKPTEVARDELVGESAPIQKVRQLVKRIGPSDLCALLHGPSGSGKEVVARAIHRASTRAQRPMIAINCASVAPTLLDAELFGYRKGAFTGAVADRVGLIEAAHESTLFLDEIGDMPLPMQAALLRVLEQREVKRLGDNLPRAVDFRLISATHRDLDEEVAAGRFRADLLFRLREITLTVPSLAERGGDIELLSYMFLRQTEAQLGLAMHTLTSGALEALQRHAWPGNVRELKATMRRAAILAESKLVTEVDLGLSPRARATPETPARVGGGTSLHDVIDEATGAALMPLGSLRDEVVRRYVLHAIERCGGDREAAAKALEIGVRTLYRYIS